MTQETRNKKHETRNEFFETQHITHFTCAYA